jgi:hypothetical protein
MGLAVKVLDIAVLLDFFENGNPPPVGPGHMRFHFDQKRASFSLSVV